MYFNKENIPI